MVGRTGTPTLAVKFEWLEKDGSKVRGGARKSCGDSRQSWLLIYYSQLLRGEDQRGTSEGYAGCYPESNEVEEK